MKDRFVTFAAAVAALVVTFIIVMPPRGSGDADLSLPTTEDRGGSGLIGLKTWLERGGIPIHSLRRRYPELMDTTVFAETGNLLIVSFPHFREALQSEWQALSGWIDSGNSLLILGYAYDRPDWFGSDGCLCDAVQLLDELGWTLSSSKPDKDEADSEGFDGRIDRLHAGLQALTPTLTTIQPLSTFPIVHTVSNVESRVIPALTDEIWQLSTTSDQLAVRLFAFDADPDKTVIWQVEAGRGRIFLSLAGDIFSNEMLNRADNARLFKNLLSRMLSGKGQVIFDDFHFGLSDLYDPEQFFSDSRLHRTIGLILLFWLLYVLGDSKRLAPVRHKKAEISAIDSVEAMAGFFAGRLDKKILAQELTRHLLQDLRQNRRLPTEEAVWQWLERHPQIPATSIALLRDAAQQRCSQLNVLTDTLTEIRTKTLS